MARVLLHACCAPCSAAILEWMMANGVQPYIYYCNPNITPQEEYEHRRDELKRYAERLGVPFDEAPYDHEAWLEAVRGLEGEPERGKRCLQCFRYRLMQSAKRAQELGIGTFTTSLASSRWKSLAQTTEAGNEAAAEVSREGEPVSFDARNWRKGGLQERRNELLREMQFYNQLWCGCEFSRRKEEKEDA